MVIGRLEFNLKLDTENKFGIVHTDYFVLRVQSKDTSHTILRWHLFRKLNYYNIERESKEYVKELYRKAEELRNTPIPNCDGSTRR